MESFWLPKIFHFQFTVCCLLTYTVLTIGFIGGPYEGKESDGVVTITVGLLGSTVLHNEIPVLFSTQEISGISNAAEGKLSVNVL